MPKRIYIGSHQEVVLPDGTLCKKGSSIDVPDGIDVKELDASGNWESPSTTKTNTVKDGE